MIFSPVINIFFLSIFTIMFGYILDFTVSKKSLLYYFKEKPDLYISGIRATLFNLIIISPINYFIAINFLISKDFFKSGLACNKLFLMLICHNLLYFLLHYMVHKIEILKPIHYFHHKFKKNIPSISNAVSPLEFQTLYVLPFLFGLLIFKPNVITFDVSILIISILSTIIHCYEFSNFKWIPGFVSPKKHCLHHETYSATYSAPLLDLDFLKKNLSNRLYGILSFKKIKSWAIS